MAVTIKKAIKPPKMPTPAVIEVQQPMATVSKDFPDGTSTQEQVPVGDPIEVPQPHANIGVSMGMTINTGDYSNIKFSVSFFCPADVNEDSINGTYEQVKAWVDSKVDEIHTEIRDQLG